MAYGQGMPKAARILVALKPDGWAETRRSGVGRDSYSLDGGHPAEQYVLDDRRSEWVVYYSERGAESGLRSFATEDLACRYLAGLVLADPTARGR